MKLSPALAAAILAVSAATGRAAAPEHLPPKAAYLERCGGCHGVDGLSAQGLVPTLKGSAGYFLCDERTRSYVESLPNVAFAQISDDELAGLLNYVAYSIGGRSAPTAAQPFTADEVGRFRRRPLTIPNLTAFRRKVVSHLIARCGAPARLMTDYGFSDAKR